MVIKNLEVNLIKLKLKVKPKEAQWCKKKLFDHDLNFEFYTYILLKTNT